MQFCFLQKLENLYILCHFLSCKALISDVIHKHTITKKKLSPLNFKLQLQQ